MVQYVNKIGEKFYARKKFLPFLLNPPLTARPHTLISLIAVDERVCMTVRLCVSTTTHAANSSWSGRQGIFSWGIQGYDSRITQSVSWYSTDNRCRESRPYHEEPPFSCFQNSLHSTPSIMWPVYYRLGVFNILKLSRNLEEEKECPLLQVFRNALVVGWLGSSPHLMSRIGSGPLLRSMGKW